MNQFISAHDVPDINTLIHESLQYKQDPHKDHTLGAGKRMGLIFLNPSMRTRLSTQIAARNLGMEAIVFNMGGGEGWQIELEDGAIMNGSSVEHIKDAAPVLGAYFDILGIRTFPSLQDRERDYAEQMIHQLKRYAGVPVVSLESATLHPLQSLADVLTIKETFTLPRKPKVVLTWAPHIKPLPQCVANSFAQWVNAWGEAELVITHPEGYDLAAEFTAGATIEYDQQQALKGADYVYVKNWSSYRDYGSILSEDQSWMLTNEHLKKTNSARVMHCLPVRRNVELSDEVLDGPNSLVTAQAANRVWAAQAVLAQILKKLNNAGTECN